MFPERLAETQERQLRYRRGHLNEWERRQASTDERFALRRDAVAEDELAMMLAAADDLSDWDCDDGTEAQAVHR